ncbi:dihydropyrimidinase [Paracoccus aerius]|uniref:Dihydropyrimidinase n=1 Tax=Paracoccus aerius TaxID=1915382 RepID=A0ABS1S9A6_9RHOB|nr:dihydropyrimidinase [Paracoccus aerius]MBL3675327.1 dihydropyrimidinase [Paracoccus aerius]GHG32608.1 dihydropyrimidinase [Paracoccus aerius]
MFDIIIRNGTIATASDVFIADIGLRDGAIVQIGGEMTEARQMIDATGKYVLPGGIDSHVHLSQPQPPGIEMCDDFESGTRSALIGGNTTVMPFCLQEKGRPLREVLAEYHALAEGRCHTDVSFHLIISEITPQLLGQELPALVEDGYTSFKVFMTYEGLRLRDDEILETMDCARRSGALVMVHCENEDAIRYLIGRHEMAGDVAPKAHATTRPTLVEREAAHRALSLAQVVDVPIVIVHVSNREAMDEIRRARERGQKVIGETCPQYLMLTADDLDRDNWEGARYVCSPPPRDKASQEACWEGLEQGVFDIYSSDHCPFRFNDDKGKLNPPGKTSFRHIPNGIPGIAMRLPILFSEGVMKGRIDISRFVALSSTNHAKTYGLYPRKGSITIGADADLSIWDPAVQRRITHDDLQDGCDYTPYEGLEVQGWPTTVLLRGEVVVDDGQLVSSRRGVHLARDRSPLATKVFNDKTQPSI